MWANHATNASLCCELSCCLRAWCLEENGWHPGLVYVCKTFAIGLYLIKQTTFLNWANDSFNCTRGILVSNLGVNYKMLASKQVIISVNWQLISNTITRLKKIINVFKNYYIFRASQEGYFITFQFILNSTSSHIDIFLHRVCHSSHAMMLEIDWTAWPRRQQCQ